MKKIAIVSLILLLVVSLGTSVFLLLGQKKAVSEADGLKKSAKLNSDNVVELKDKLKEQEATVEAAEKAKAVADKDLSAARIKAASADRQAITLQQKLDEATSNPPTAPASTNEIAILQKQLDDAKAEAEAAQQQITSLNEQVENSKKAAAELEAAQAKLEKVEALEQKIADLEKKRPVEFTTPAIPEAAPRAPGKLKPKQISPKQPTPQPKE